MVWHFQNQIQSKSGNTLKALLVSEGRTGNVAKMRLLVNPYGPEIQTYVCFFLEEKDLNLEKGVTQPRESPSMITIMDCTSRWKVG